mmetsp:Transcript_59765/g.182578  ORF Transcript_59765/g.182578 Transcript_59765/m.182578 type:complete len:200 (+) Transcript_59765:1070-1669(+)
MFSALTWSSSCLIRLASSARYSRNFASLDSNFGAKKTFRASALAALCKSRNCSSSMGKCCIALSFICDLYTCTASLRQSRNWCCTTDVHADWIVGTTLLLIALQYSVARLTSIAPVTTWPSIFLGFSDMYTFLTKVSTCVRNCGRNDSYGKRCMLRRSDSSATGRTIVAQSRSRNRSLITSRSLFFSSWPGNGFNALSK